MTYDDIIKHYVTQQAAADAIGTTQPAVANWKARGEVPRQAQLEFERTTGGVLKADEPEETRS